MDIPRGGLTIEGLTYDEEGDVEDWGAANDNDVVWIRGGAISVPCWRLVRVSVWIRNFAGRSPHHGDHGWWYYLDFWAGSWSAVHPVFAIFFSTGGWYHRVRLECEEFQWTAEEGWD